MKAVILDGSNDQKSPFTTVNSIVTSKFEEEGWTVDNYVLREEKIATCIGCFGCWLKTPGVCILKDKGQEIAKKVIQADLVVMLTPITFGGYSYQLKKMVDRLIPNILPFFTRIGGEIHHQPRYDKNPDMLVIGYLPQPDAECEDIFSKLIKRNAINMHSLHYQVDILTDDVDLGKVAQFIENVKVLA